MVKMDVGLQGQLWIVGSEIMLLSKKHILKFLLFDTSLEVCILSYQWVKVSFVHFTFAHRFSLTVFHSRIINN
jgi:hypothetical protein